MTLAAGEWWLPRGDGRNLARADRPGHFAGPPVEVWSMPTGAEIRYARTVPCRGDEALLVQAGPTLQVIRWDGEPVWRHDTLGVSRVVHVGRFGRPDRWHALVTTDERTAALVDVDTGTTTWSWTTEEQAKLAERGCSKVFGPPGRLRWVCFSLYSTRGRMVDFTDPDHPEVVWEVDLGDSIDIGFGPNVVVDDVFGTGEPHVVLSSRRGSTYDDADRTESIVLGRDDGHVYQAVLDSASGAIRAQTRYRPDPTVDYPCARPYGLLQTVPWDRSGRRGIVLASCQVEEYLSVTSHTADGLGRAWGRFVERDWPEDHRELRPQVTSLADVRGTGRPDLVVGLWDGQRWRTIVLDVRRGFDGGVLAELPGRYFWGCHDLDGDGRPELVVSTETGRRTTEGSLLEAVDARTLRTVATLRDATLLTSADPELPAGVNVLADIRSAVEVTDSSGRAGLLVRRADGVHVWNADGLRRIADAAYVRADWRGGELVLSTETGEVLRCGADLRPVAPPVSVQGRYCQPLVWRREYGPEVVTDVAGGSVVGGMPAPGRPDALDHRWDVAGTLPAMHRDSVGCARLSVAVDGAVAVHSEPGTAVAAHVLVGVSAPPAVALVPYGDAFRVLVNMHTGTLTAGIAVYDETGNLRWLDAAQGGHPSRPGVAPHDGDWLVATDDHGRLRLYDDAGRVRADTDWTAAYTTPVAVPDANGGTAALLRADGIHGLELLGLDGTPRWRKHSTLWRYFPGRSALARDGGGDWVLGAVGRDGRLDAVDVADGSLRWSYDAGPTMPQRAVAAGDVDGDGVDEFLVGTLDGRLLCVGLDGDLRWEHRFPAAVTNPVVASVFDLDGVEILVATADGRLRVLASRPLTT